MITAIVIHIGTFGAIQLKTMIANTTTTKAVSVQGLSAYILLKFLITTVVPDAEFRYFLLNTIVNQLRYPNSHTYFFSNLFLQLFLDLNDEYTTHTNSTGNSVNTDTNTSSSAAANDILLIQEQITRVFLERLIVHRPHPVSY